ncbi:MAG: glutathione peroxidase [Cyanobacteria bacterium RYN_339]|nr:glutathione peroxidase [Cyanobacteria bacterium RYN_339]
MPAKLYDLTVNRIDGTPVPLSEFEGRVLLVVNVASKCGLTPQYEGLEKLYEAYAGRGLEVLGFPANEFMGQEPGSNEQIQSFCTLNYGVKFPLFEKIVVKGAGRHPLYDHLTQAQPTASSAGGLKQWMLRLVGGKRQPGDISWNFEKFLISRKGDVVARFAPTIAPNDPAIVTAIERELALS